MASITLYRGVPGNGTYTWSPFVNKVEARLRFANISYRAEVGSVLQSPRRKIPYITTVDENGVSKTSSDSTLILEDFVEDGLLPDLNARLTPEEKMLDLGLRALLEDKLYFYQSCEKWFENYYTMREHVFAGFSYPLRVVIGYMAFRSQKQTLYGQGTLRFTTEEITRFKTDIWKEVNNFLISSKSKAQGDGPFWALGGKEPTEADATLFGFIAGCSVCFAGPETQRIINSFPVVVEYARRIHDRFFPEYTFWK